MRSPRKRSTVVQTRKQLTLREDGGIRVVVVADTHGRPHPDAARHIRAARPDAILHGGDIGDLGVLDQLAELAPLIAVRGNIDEHATDLPDVVTIDVCDRAQSVLRLLLMHIAVYGPKVRADAARLARASDASIIVCGHSHVPFIGRDAGLVLFNPGSIGPRRFALPIVFGVLELEDRKVKMRHVSCETGATWMP